MKFDIVKENRNEYLKRKELDVRIDHTGEPTPTKASLQQLIAQQLKKDVTHIEILNIFTDKGRSLAASKTYIWEEPKVVDLRKVVKKKAGEAATAETQKVEAPKPASGTEAAAKK